MQRLREKQSITGQTAHYSTGPPGLWDGDWTKEHKTENIIN
jgi:hypothetical protein